MAQTGWEDVKQEALRRIQAREWPPGALIPPEEELAAELGCARATVNRALRSLAEAGLLNRKRRAGTRVPETPVRPATLNISLIADEIGERGASASFALLTCDKRPLPDSLAKQLKLGPKPDTLYVEALHLADNTPYLHEYRWINLNAVPQAAAADFSEVSANEWLLRNAPFEQGTLDYSAAPAGARAAKHLACRPDTPTLKLDRLTRGLKEPVTWVRMTYAPGHQLRMNI